MLGAAALCMLVRRTHPLLAVAGVMTALATQVLFLTPPDDLLSITLLLVATSYAAGAHLEGRRSVRGLVLVLVPLIGTSIIVDPDRHLLPGRRLRRPAMAGGPHDPQPDQPRA